MLRYHGPHITLTFLRHLSGAELVWRSRYSSNKALHPSATTTVSTTVQVLA